MLAATRGASQALAFFLLLLALPWAATPCNAHLLNMSKARIVLLPGGEIEVRLALDLLLTAGSRETYFGFSQLAQPLDDPRVQAALAPLPRAVDLTLGGVRVPLTLTELVFPRESKAVFLDPLAWPRTELTLQGSLAGLAQLPADRGLRVRYGDSFRFEEPIANTFEDITSGRSQTRWLVTSQLSPVFDADNWFDNRAPPPVADVIDWYGLLDFARAGMRHILPAGADHLLFIAGLCLGAVSLRALIGVISLFTLAHSVTLCAMALGWISVPAIVVEAMILLSILWVAVANLLGRTQGHLRSGIVLLFGLLHGLGFARALLDIGLPSEALILSLLAFNVGVEAGQLVFVIMVLGALAILRRFNAFERSHTLLPVAATTRRYGSLLIALSVVTLLGPHWGQYPFWPN